MAEVEHHKPTDRIIFTSSAPKAQTKSNENRSNTSAGTRISEDTDTSYNKKTPCLLTFMTRVPHSNVFFIDACS